MDGVTASQRTAPCRWCRDSQQVTGTEPKKSRVYDPAGEVPQGPMAVVLHRTRPQRGLIAAQESACKKSYNCAWVGSAVMAPLAVVASAPQPWAWVMMAQSSFQAGSWS